LANSLTASTAPSSAQPATYATRLAGDVQAGARRGQIRRGVDDHLGALAAIKPKGHLTSRDSRGSMATLGETGEAKTVQRIHVNGVELEYEARGTGDPVLLVHGAHIAEAFEPLVRDGGLAERHRVIRYHRRGFAGSDRVAPPFAIEQQAADARTLLEALGVGRAHVVGHSYGGAIALQLALDAPPFVHSLALLEPALLMVPSAEQFAQALTPVIERYQAGDKDGAIDGFLTLVMGSGYRSVLDRVLPGAFEQAVADADTFFAVELPSLPEWRFGAEQAAGIDQPILRVLGSDSLQMFNDIDALLQQWFPNSEPSRIPDATHALAKALEAFFDRHPTAALV
jgi:pimeloyl-ACP methyl ester carboxylesterase